MTYIPSRINPHPQSNIATAQADVRHAVEKYSNFKLDKVYAHTQFVFISSCHRAWSLCYTTEMRLEDAAYEVSNLWG